MSTPSGLETSDMATSAAVTSLLIPVQVIVVEVFFAVLKDTLSINEKRLAAGYLLGITVVAFTATLLVALLALNLNQLQKVGIAISLVIQAMVVLIAQLKGIEADAKLEDACVDNRLEKQVNQVAAFLEAARQTKDLDWENLPE